MYVVFQIDKPNKEFIDITALRLYLFPIGINVLLNNIKLNGYSDGTEEDSIILDMDNYNTFYERYRMYKSDLSRLVVSYINEYKRNKNLTSILQHNVRSI